MVRTSRSPLPNATKKNLPGPGLILLLIANQLFSVYCAKRTLRPTAKECPVDRFCSSSPPSPNNNHFLRAANGVRDSAPALR